MHTLAARYLQDSIQGQSIQAPVQVKTSSHEVSSHPVPNDPAPETHTNIHQEAPEPVLIESGPPRETPPGPAMPNHAQPEPITTLRSSNHVPEPEVALQGTSYQPSRVEELLMDIRRALVGTHNDLVRHSNSSRYYVMMNEKGEIPWLNNLPYIKPLSSTNLNRDYTDAEIVGYLRCYNLGHDLIYDDGTEKLKQGSESAARKLLAKFLYTGCTA
ncbi:hypothetical protein FRC11_013202 [Ceratobasidium sp. 423]|nr:hypothetical protein FRC11_013202 [Ceratobasidium sp. 423]